MINRLVPFVVASLASTYICMAAGLGTHGSGTYPSPFPVGTTLLELHVGDSTHHLNVSQASYDSPLIIIRYLGYTCSHCVEQLSYLNRRSAELKRLGIRVIAFSEDDERTNGMLVQRMGYDTSVIQIYSDPDDVTGKRIGAVREEQDTYLDLHASLVLYRDTVRLAMYTNQPYMDIEQQVSTAVDALGPTSANILIGDVHPSDKYLTGPVTVTTVAGPADGIDAPIDLDFNHSPLNPTDLWVVLARTESCGMAIIHHAPDATKRVVRLKKDSRASHFMWRTHAISIGTNGAFATAQNGAPGNHHPFYQFMGPTLWSLDTAVFASRYQGDPHVLGSHLDMLHQSPQNLGIAHDSGTVYWVSDGYYKDITRFDFKEPHEIGGDDHRDGVIRRFTDAHVSPGILGEPGHIALDKQTGMLYIVDPGANIVTRLNTRTGAYARQLVPPKESDENLAEYSEWKGAKVDTVISSGLGEPVGIEVKDNRLFVGDRASGRIHVYRINADAIEPMGTIETGAGELLGICYGPDDRLWFVDRANSIVGRLDTKSDAYFTPDLDIVATGKHATVTFTYHHGANTTSTLQVLAYARIVTADGEGEWKKIPFDAQIPVKPGESKQLSIPFELADTLHAFEVEVREDLGDQQDGIRARTIVIPNTIQRVVVDDAPIEQFRIAEAVSQTNRVGYVSLRSVDFVRVASDLPQLQTVLWNSGSFGEITVTDDAVLSSLLDRTIEVFLIADDPLLLRTDLPGASAFFNRLGVRLKGVDVVPNDNGQRVFYGVTSDTISHNLGMVNFQLPRLDHARGQTYVPAVLVASTSDSTHVVLQSSDSSRILSARYTSEQYRTVILGVNAARFLDGTTRTTYLDQALEWLETSPQQDTSTPTSVQEAAVPPTLSLSIRGNVTTSTTTALLVGVEPSVDVALYSVAGQQLINLGSGELNGSRELQINLSSLSNGTYFVIARAGNSVVYQTVIKQ